MIKKVFNKLSKMPKINFVIFLVIITTILSIGIPSLARYKNRSSIVGLSTWDGTVASKFRSGTGTKSDPYIISNGAELAYFSNQLENNNFNNTYINLNADIIINNGIFSYDKIEGIKYTINSNTYYVKPYTNEYYDTVDYTNRVGTINTFNSLKNFKGVFNGNSYSIYGLYITSNTLDELALFTNLEGNVNDLYVENSLINGGYITAGIASSTTNSNLNNILYSGYVIGNTSSNTSTTTINIDNKALDLNNNNVTDYFDLTNLISPIKGTITNIKLNGKLDILGDQGTVMINNTLVENGNFSIDLGNDIIESIPINFTTTGNTTFNITDISYVITYDYAIASGIAASTTNTTLKNVVNKASIYGNLNASGIVATANSNLTLKQSYNKGEINSDNLVSGLIGNISQNNGNVSITNSYNGGNLVGQNTFGLIGNIINSNLVSISNSFNATNTDYMINEITNTTVNITNSYLISGATVKIGTSNNEFVLTSLDNLKTKSYLKTYLSFNEFIDSTDLNANESNVWVYEDNALPILCIDDINNPIASIYVSNYSWNNIGYELNSVKFNSNFAFSIEGIDNLKPLKEIYYYISNSKTPLTKSEIDNITTWTNYTNIVNITEEGFYTIYAKVIDYNDNVTYLNTDLLILDLSGASINISTNDQSWTTLNTNINNYYINKASNINITATDELSGVNSIKYYISNIVMQASDLEKLEDTSWIDYNNIVIDKKGTYIIYAKVVDNANFVSYANSDYIIFNGYNVTSIYAGRHTTADQIYVTNNSSVTINFDYNDTNKFNSGDAHALFSNILLPVNTKITLIDSINNKQYQYKIETSDDIYNYAASSLDANSKYATYKLELFSEIGKSTNDVKFTDNILDNVNENFSVIIDFADTNITTNYENVKITLGIINDSKIVRNTLNDSVKTFNIYNNATPTLDISTTYSGNIIYNSDSNNIVDIKTLLNYKKVDNLNIYDTTLEDMTIGLAIKMVDKDENIIDKKHLKNLTFKIGDLDYYPDNDGIVRINLNNGINDINDNLIIVTKADNISLAEGTYYFKIYSYIAYDGLYSNNKSTELTIPVEVISSKNNINYSFDCISDNDVILDKNKDITNLSFKVLQKGKFTNPNIRVSLYKKKELTAFNQEYIRIDLASFSTNNLELASDNVYYLAKKAVTYKGTLATYNTLSLNLKTNILDYTGYKLVFELYDGDMKIGSIDKNFIVK